MTLAALAMAEAAESHLNHHHNRRHIRIREAVHQLNGPASWSRRFDCKPVPEKS